MGGDQRAHEPTVQQGGGPTLDDLVVGVWEGLAAHRTVACLACGEASMTPRYGAGPAPVGGRCAAAGRRSPVARRPFRLQRLAAARPLQRATGYAACTPDGCGGEKSRRGKSGHHRAWWSAQADPGKPAGKCHRDIPPMAGPHVRPAQARVKRCGKSAPASWRHGGQANPTRCKAKQDRSQAARQGPGRPLDGWSSTTRSGLQACYGEGPLRRALASSGPCRATRRLRGVRFSLLYEHQLPRPWDAGAEHRLLQEALEQVELADRLGFDAVWAVEHHFLEEYSHSSAPGVFLAAASQRTKTIRLGFGDPAAAARLPAPRAGRRDRRDARPLSDGRVELGTGETSSRRRAARASASTATTKRAQWDEALDVVARMMVETPFAGVDGQLITMPPRNVVPKPLQTAAPAAVGRVLAARDDPARRRARASAR